MSLLDQPCLEMVCVCSPAMTIAISPCRVPLAVLPTEPDVVREVPRLDMTSAIVVSTPSGVWLSPFLTCRGPSQANAVTALVPAAQPHSMCSGSHGLSVSFSPIQYVYFPGCPRQERSNSPGIAPQVFISTSRLARPMVALARLPGPNRLLRQLIWSCSTTGPLTISMIAEPPRLADGPTRLNCGCTIASTAATTTGAYSGKHPAITAFNDTSTT